MGADQPGGERSALFAGWKGSAAVFIAILGIGVIWTVLTYDSGVNHADSISIRVGSCFDTDFYPDPINAPCDSPSADVKVTDKVQARDQCPFGVVKRDNEEGHTEFFCTMPLRSRKSRRSHPIRVGECVDTDNAVELVVIPCRYSGVDAKIVSRAQSPDDCIQGAIGDRYKGGRPEIFCTVPLSGKSAGAN